MGLLASTMRTMLAMAMLGTSCIAVGGVHIRPAHVDLVAYEDSLTGQGSFAKMQDHFAYEMTLVSNALAEIKDRGGTKAKEAIARLQEMQSLNMPEGLVNSLGQMDTINKLQEMKKDLSLNLQTIGSSEKDPWQVMKDFKDALWKDTNADVAQLIKTTANADSAATATTPDESTKAAPPSSPTPDSHAHPNILSAMPSWDMDLSPPAPVGLSKPSMDLLAKGQKVWDKYASSRARRESQKIAKHVASHDSDATNGRAGGNDQAGSGNQGDLFDPILDMSAMKRRPHSNAMAPTPQAQAPPQPLSEEPPSNPPSPSLLEDTPSNSSVEEPPLPPKEDAPTPAADTPDSLPPTVLDVMRKRCVFLHGTGQVVPQLPGPTEQFETYWGDIKSYTPQCSERVFVHADTVNQAWHDKALYTEYCRVASGDVRHGSIIHDTIVFTHSAGTLILGSGIEAGACDFDPVSSSWYVVGYHPPSMNNLTSAVSMYGLVNYTLVRSLTELGQLMGDIHWVSPDGHYSRMYSCFNEMSELCPDLPSDGTRNRIAKIVKERVSGAMCGCSPRGLNRYHAAGLQLMSWAWADEPNDGMVPCGPCMAGMGETFSTTYRSAFYAGQLNHQDITCLNGDGDTDDAKPCSWFSLCT